jgi:hypothetical protein
MVATVVFYLLGAVYLVVMATATGIVVIAKWGPDWLVEVLQAAQIIPRPQKTDDHQHQLVTSDDELTRWLATKMNRKKKGDRKE